MGETFALAAAVVWACAVILFKRAGETVPPFAMNFFRVVVSIPLFLVTLTVLRQPLLPAAPQQDYLILAVSGVLGIAVADTLFHMSLNRVGAGITAVVDCLYSPTVVLLAYLFIAETFTFWDMAGMCLVIFGVLVASQHQPLPGTDTRTLFWGIVLGALSMLALAGSIVLAKPVLDRSPVFWATALRQVACLFAMLPVALAPAKRAEVRAVFRPGRNWRFALTASVLGSYLSVTLWIAGMKYTQAGIAAILNQTTTVFILLLATVFLKESFTRRKAVAAVLALGGILMVTLL